MKVRGKFRVSSVTNFATSPGSVYAEAKLDAVYTDKPEDHTFCKATPNASMQMFITIPEVLEKLKLGKLFCIDFTEAD